ncbi:MAG: hypothetical protein ACYCPW_03120 [Nitrososphaerales archaeon]
MSTAQRMRNSVNASFKSTEEFIESTKESLQKELSKKAPKIQHDLDKSFEEAGRGLSKALNSIEKKTDREQVDLLNAYKTFLKKQTAFVDDRVKKIRKG